MRLEGISQKEVITVLVELPICDRATCNSQVTRYVVKRVQTLAPEAGAQKWRVQNRMICDRQLTAWMSSGHLDQRRSCPMRLLLEGLYGPGRRAKPPGRRRRSEEVLLEGDIRCLEAMARCDSWWWRHQRMSSLSM